MKQLKVKLWSVPYFCTRIPFSLFSTVPISGSSERMSKKFQEFGICNPLAECILVTNNLPSDYKSFSTLTFGLQI
jgi:hypothetical protein